MGDIANLAADAAKEAGIYLLNNFGKIKNVESKGDRNLATNLDKEAERMIVDRIKVNFPATAYLPKRAAPAI
jgi:fructose-1,6-bisphosphatase/inositol monophosphatase family enzyme